VVPPQKNETRIWFERLGRNLLQGGTTEQVEVLTRLVEDIAFVPLSLSLDARADYSVSLLTSYFHAFLPLATHGRTRRSTLSSTSQLVPPGFQQRHPQQRRCSSSSPSFQPHSLYPSTPSITQRSLFSIRLGLRRSSSSTMVDFLSRSTTRLLSPHLTQSQPSPPFPALRSGPRTRSRLFDRSTVGRRPVVGERIASPAADERRRWIRRRSRTRNGSSSSWIRTV